ncbi:MAG: 3-isopropylmalate dehydrogenase [Rhodospirillales bacterium]|nr:3-isopropylmalate dehydrogenase [Rhodospirillales bacterium]MCB9964754.1 3-isopropylmalate dehydrogenase [Rhodospirillales bacterium]MCB9973754.1 3-isopropylmalate dehydrogenase [Rhodospirillales bacterium]MCB9980666.1 3-isopropylmalate dehydrogenase [Rhodospirillales bacterium]
MTQTSHKILLLPGDGIGPEGMAEVSKLANWLSAHHYASFELETDLVGGAAIDAHGVPVTDETIAKAKAADAVMLGAVGGPKWDRVDYAIRPEAGLLKLRKELDLFANLRPALVFDALIEASTLKPEIVRGLDILIVRELTGGVYFGEPRGIEILPNGEKRGFNTQTYTTSEIRRVAEVAFDLAGKRSKKVTSCEKANVMESGKLWREVVTELHAEKYPGIALSHMYADNCAMQLLRNPQQFDVIVTDNLFGDILSDEASMLTGSLGMLPSASLGAVDATTGKRYAMYEPVHGSAPDIAGQGKANPLATILSFAMCLRYSLNRGDLADAIEQAAQNVLNSGLRTPDIMAEHCTQISTADMGDALIRALETSLFLSMRATGASS